MQHQRDDILAIAHGTSRYKERSLDTGRHHLETVERRGHQVEICLLGDSMIERMLTTAQWENLQPWPSGKTLPDSNTNTPEVVANYKEAEAFVGRMPRGDDSLEVAQKSSRFKDRSLDTAKRHLQTMSIRGDKEVQVGLLGGSNIERMSTTGQWETLRPWPSKSMFPDSNIDALNAGPGDKAARVCRKSGVANFGCGGDKIENVLYRVIGDQSHDLKGLANKLYPAGNSSARQPASGPKLWVIHAGTNNLHPKKGLNSKSLEAMEVLLRTLYHLTYPGPRFLLTGLFYRTDIPDDLVYKANVALEAIVVKIQQEFPGVPQSPEQIHGGQGNDLTPQPQLFEFLEAPEMNPAGGWLDDHVHLNQEGYRIWMEKLVPKVNQLLRS
jgi:hypothetical protein